MEPISTETRPEKGRIEISATTQEGGITYTCIHLSICCFIGNARILVNACSQHVSNLTRKEFVSSCAMILLYRVSRFPYTGTMY